MNKTIFSLFNSKCCLPKCVIIYLSRWLKRDKKGEWLTIFYYIKCITVCDKFTREHHDINLLVRVVRFMRNNFWKMVTDIPLLLLVSWYPSCKYASISRYLKTGMMHIHFFSCICKVKIIWSGLRNIAPQSSQTSFSHQVHHLKRDM